jgi:hypothetical protein
MTTEVNKTEQAESRFPVLGQCLDTASDSRCVPEHHRRIGLTRQRPGRPSALCLSDSQQYAGFA